MLRFASITEQFSTEQALKSDADTPNGIARFCLGGMFNIQKMFALDLVTPTNRRSELDDLQVPIVFFKER